MFILERLTSRSSRSLAVMTGFAHSVAGRGHGDHAGPPTRCMFACSRPFPSRRSVSPPQVKE